MTGFGSFCLVSREELSGKADGLVNFQDIDRDGMIDMFYADRSGDGLAMYIHYNQLENADRASDKNKIESAFQVIN